MTQQDDIDYGRVEPFEWVSPYKSYIWASSVLLPDYCYSALNLTYFASLLISYPGSTTHLPVGTAAVSRSRSFPVFWASAWKAAMSSSHRSENLCLSSAGLPLDPGYSQSRSSPSNPCVLKYVIVVEMKFDLVSCVATWFKWRMDMFWSLHQPKHIHIHVFDQPVFNEKNE